MSYTEKVIQPGENVRFSGHVHWIVYLRGVVIVLLGVIVAVILRRFDPSPSGDISIPALVAIAAGLFFGAISLAAAWWRRLTTEVTVTDNRIIYKRGFIRRHTFEMNMNKVESVHVNQSVFGRMFDYGDIVIRGTGSSFEPLALIAHPLDFRNYVTTG
ncbi:MAG TPA: PH domain-containing protein [Stellaceae bacterium]|jgi:uncharacterized membrane protein YdbT with pleckstrin-like domain|nr:PH domain-containing protein [Stellaceae bacterium]